MIFQNKSLAQTYFEYSKEAHETVASLSQKMHVKQQPYFKLSKYMINFALLYSIALAILSSPSLALVTAKRLFSHCFLAHLLRPVPALLLWFKSFNLHSRQASSSLPSNAALLWWSGLLCFLTFPPAFFPSSLPFLILYPLPKIPQDSSCVSEHISYIMISSHTYNFSCPVYHIDTPLHECPTSMNSVTSLDDVQENWTMEAQECQSTSEPGRSYQSPAVIPLLRNCFGYFSPCEHVSTAQTVLRWAASSHMHCGKC